MLLRLVPTSEVAKAEALLDRVRAMLWRLARSSSPPAGTAPAGTAPAGTPPADRSAA